MLGFGRSMFLVYCLAGYVFAADWYAKDVRFGGHDPSIVRHESGYALMVTNNMLTLYTSEDAMNWKDHGKQMQTIPAWLKSVAPTMEDIWAPDIYYFGDEYRVYYTGSVFGKRSSGIGVMGAKSIVPNTDGFGWKDYGEVVHTVLSDSYNAIDADVAVDNKGEYWMVFGSWGTGIKMVKLDAATGRRSSSDTKVYDLASRNGKGEEGPSLIEHDGKYFLFTAWDVCCKMGSAAEIEGDTYHTRVGRADQVTGPYLDKAGVDMMAGGGTTVLERYGRYYGPGGGEAFKDLNRIRFVHHYYDNGAAYIGAPTLHVRDIVFTEDNWPEMGQPFLGRYLSAEAEHGLFTRSVSGDLVITNSNEASNGEYVAYINTSGTVIHLPMNIMQAGDYLLRYRYANGGEEAATHNVSINGKNQEVKLPVTGAWGVFPEKSVVYIPATLKRGSNFIDVKPGTNFSELDRIDFLRIIRDTIPMNGFDNGIKISLTEGDELSIKNGGYALFENVILDSIVGHNVSLQARGSGVIKIRLDKKDGEVLSTCDLSNLETLNEGDWSVVECSEISKMNGIHDLFVTAEGDAVLGNLRFGEKTTNVKKRQIVNGSHVVKSVSDGYEIHFAKPGFYKIFVFDALGQKTMSRSGYFEGIVRIPNGDIRRSFVRIVEK